MLGELRGEVPPFGPVCIVVGGAAIPPPITGECPTQPPPPPSIQIAQKVNKGKVLTLSL